MSGYKIQKIGSLKKGDGFVYLSTTKKWMMSELSRRDCPFLMFKPDLMSELYLYGLAACYLKHGVAMVQITAEGRRVLAQQVRREAKRPKKDRPDEAKNRWSSRTLGYRSDEIAVRANHKGS